MKRVREIRKEVEVAEKYSQKIDDFVVADIRYLLDLLEWQPFADAPRDGTEIEVLLDGGDLRLIYWKTSEEDHMYDGWWFKCKCKEYHYCSPSSPCCESIKYYRIPYRPEEVEK